MSENERFDPEQFRRELEEYLRKNPPYDKGKPDSDQTESGDEERIPSKPIISVGGDVEADHLVLPDDRPNIIIGGHIKADNLVTGPEVVGGDLIIRSPANQIYPNKFKPSSPVNPGTFPTGKEYGNITGNNINIGPDGVTVDGKKVLPITNTPNDQPTNNAQVTETDKGKSDLFSDDPTFVVNTPTGTTVIGAKETTNDLPIGSERTALMNPKYTSIGMTIRNSVIGGVVFNGSWKVISEEGNDNSGKVSYKLQKISD